MSNEINPDDLNPQELARVEVVFKRLPPLWRTVLYARREGETFAEIAEDLGYSKQYMWLIAARANRRLSHVLADPTDNPFGYWRGCGLSTRTANCLVNDGIRSPKDLRLASDERLMRIPNFGRRCLEEIHQLIERGVSLGARLPYPTNNPTETDR